jgi:NAD+ synthase
LARFMKLPDVICNTTPTTDTYSLPQGQDEFYFALPYQQMDYALWALNHGVAASELAAHLGITPAQADHVYADILAKRRTTSYLHARPLLVEAVPEVHV